MQCLVWLRWGVVAVVVMALGWGLEAAGAAPTTPSPTSQFGINWIGSAEMEPRPERFQMGAATGVGWDRWVFYWADMERTAGNMDWSRQDRTFLAEAASGLSINAVLLTTPDHYARAGLKGQALPRVGEKRDLLYRLEAQAKGLLAPDAPNAPNSCPGPANTTPPASLYEPVFITQGGQSVVNPANHWATFVYRAVQRYKPGGELGQANGLPATFGVRAWEIWNEPDWDCSHAGAGFGGFFNGSPADYYQMVKVAYQVVKVADPSAYVVTGGLTYWANPGWFDEFAAAVKADPDKTGQARNGYYFDAVALHWYSNARNALDQSVAFSRRIQAQGLPAKPLWLTETGLPLCCDGVGYAQPDSPFHGSPDDQASYVVQNAAYALWMRRDAPSGTDRVFHFQLYDDGVDGAFGVFGLVRNPPGPGQHPTQPGVPRPGYPALQVVTRYLDGATPLSRTTTGSIERIVFQRPDGKRVTVLWNWNNTDRTVSVAATASSAVRVDRVGQEVTITPVGGSYSLTLPRATNYNTLDSTALIGGAPYLLVEGGAPPTSSTPTRTSTPTTTATPPPAPTATPLPAGCVNSVTNPGFETTTGWTLEQATRSTYQPYEGRYAAYVGLSAVPRGTTWSAARQSVVLPTSGGRITLSYAQALGAGGSANQQVVEIWADDLIIRTVEDHNPAVNQDWTTKSYDVTDLLRPYLGQTIRLVFAVRNEAGQAGPAFMRVDNVALAVCTPTTLRGRVADAAGLAIAGATVTLSGATNSPASLRTATSDDLGQFTFADLPDGSLALSASTVGYGAWPARLVTGSETVELRLPPVPSAVTNGGFEGGLSGWSLSGSTAPLATTGLSQAGVVLGDQFRPDPGQAWGNSTLSQTVRVGDQDGVGLGFAYRLETGETATGADFFEVLVIDDGQRTDILPKYWRASGDWAYLWLDLARWRGRTVTLIFNVYQTNADRPTRVWLDEVSVGATRQIERPNRLWLPHIAVGQ